MIMVSIALLGVFAVVATRLIGTTMRLYREAGAAEGEARLVDSAIEQLRRDVWGARDVKPQGTQSVLITTGAGRIVSWQVDVSETLIRSERIDPKNAAEPDLQADLAPPRQWPEIGGRVAFEWDGAELIVQGADGGADRAGGLRLLSQIKLAQSGGGR
jgi:hypothetical protein